MPAIYLRCPECRARFPFPQFLPGRKVQCPECAAVFMLNEDHAELPPALTDRHDQGWDSASERSADASRQRPTFTRPAARKRGVVMGVLVGCGLLILVVGGALAALAWWTMAPTRFPAQTEDYAQARAHFHTHLTKLIPSPQSYQRLQLPEGVREITFPSGPFRLRAWFNPPPAGRARVPAVLFVHGGFSFDLEDWIQALPFRDAGFVVMTPILRAENGQEGHFSLGYDEVDDVLAAAEALARVPGVDPDRLYAAGHSNGGTLAILAAMASKRFQAAAAFSGVPDITLMVRDAEQKWLDPIPFNPHERREIWMRSPSAFPRSFKCPTRLYYGDQEERSRLPGDCRRIAQQAHDRGLDVEAVGVPGDFMTSVAAACPRAIAFFDQIPPRR